MRKSKIVGTGRYIPPDAIPNSHFLTSEFYNKEGRRIEDNPELIIEKFKSITGIESRRYIDPQAINSEMAVLAAVDALHSSDIDPKTLDYIIVAHNFGDVLVKEDRVDLVPSFAARVKNHLKILTPFVLSHHIIIGAPDDSTQDLRRFKKLLGLGMKDLIIPINDHEQYDINDVAGWNLDDCNVDKEKLTSIVVADYLGRKPCLANKVKSALGIADSNVLAHDLVFGCPGWLEGVIFADKAIKNGHAKCVLVIGAETLSRVSDPHDRDSMIYSDGAGAVILEAVEDEENIGILSFLSRSDTHEHLNLLIMGQSNNPDYPRDEIFLKMDGNEVYQYALNYVPALVKQCLDQSGIRLEEVTKLIIHQANAKMDEKILHRLFSLYGKKRNEIPANIMPMTIGWLGNSSVATIPTLLDLLLKHELSGHEVHSGDILLFASVGAGMNINAMVYRMP